MLDRRLFLLFGLLPTAANAAHFDTDQGVMVLDGSAFHFGFEPTDPRGALSMFTRRGAEVAPPDVEAQFVGEGIEADHALAVGGTAFLARIDLSVLGTRGTLHGRRVEVKYWGRAQGSRVVGHVAWTADGQTSLTEIPFQLTGRGTDDGWLEWTSGPFDYALGGLLDPSSLLFYANGFGGFGGGGMSNTAQPVGWIDAISIDDLGPAAVPTARCNLSTESSCGAAGACWMGRCTDATAALGPMYLNAGLRQDYISRRIVEYTHLEGGRVPESMAAQVANKLNSLVIETSPIRYREGFLEALQLLEDGHASPPATRDGGAHATGICAHLGIADLVTPGDALPLVFATSGTSSIAALVRAGDALISIDGMSPSDFAHAAARYVTYYGDQRGRAVVSAPDLLSAATAIGSVVRFARPLCQTSTVVVQPCAPDQIQNIDIDLGAAQDAAWSGPAPSWTQDTIFCDYRFHRAFPGPAGTAYAFAGSSDQDGVRTVQINGVPGQADQGGQTWFDNIDTAFTNSPGKMILDQRTGFGGGIDAVDHLGSKMVTRDQFDRMHLFPNNTRPVDLPMLATWNSCQPSDVSSIVAACGDYFEFPLSGPGLIHAGETSTVAVLNGYDVSGNDFLTKILSYRRPGSTRIFAASPTAGAFGVIWSLPAVSNEISGGSLQVQDTVFRANASDANLDFQTAHGVPPDEVVLQLQSDAVRDVDTLMAAALRWLNR